MKRHGKEWTALECQVAARMFQDRTPDDYGAMARSLYYIAKELGRTVNGVRGRLRKYGTSFGDYDVSRHFEAKAESRQVHAFAIPAQVLAEREKRTQLVPSSITAAFCGDPLPGYSALDRGR